jgi:organic radical activating enzyme
MPSIRESISNLFSPVKPIPAGVYHFQAAPADPRNYRLHLRVEQDGSGVLIVNAATVLHLNQTATEYAFYLVQNVASETAARTIASRYQISEEQARKDYQKLVDQIQTLVDTPDLDPVTFLGFERHEPFSGKITAPYRLDCALTYRLPEDSRADSAPANRASRELDTFEWKSILDKAWAAGIPHVVFTGGEPTLRADLAELVAHAEAQGQVTGLLSDGLRFADPAYLDELLQTGLDHLMVILQPEQPASWTALENALAADLFVAVHLSVMSDDVSRSADLIKRLAEMGVKAVSLSAMDPGLSEALRELRRLAAALDLELVWNLPVPYSDLNPVAMETKQVEFEEGAGRAWLYIEPDGDVLPTQGASQVLGNFLRDPWEKIWKL